MPVATKAVVTVLIWLLLCSGIVLILYPYVDRWLQEKEQTRLLNEWKLYKNQLATQSGSNPSIAQASVSAEKKSDNGVLGLISIDKIGLEEPILPGSEDKQLRLGIGVVEPDRKPGGANNYVLAGHRSWTYGKQFSRLNELKEGDLIRIESGNGSYEYTVTDTFLVKPEDIEVLDNSRKKSEITLITCDPPRNPTHRLIVKGTLKNGGN
ncbi:sortase [Brevibacillus borstelensis]|uniref:class D sortase n=1 Tax=Brevibacillus borstelensis TaxID=45462 RepID=UPI0030BE9119